MKLLLTVLLICLPLISNGAKHLLYVYWPITYLLWKNVYSNPLEFFNGVVSLTTLSYIKFGSFFIFKLGFIFNFYLFIYF